MSITHDEMSPNARLSAHLQIAIGHIEAAAAMKSISAYDDPADGITDADWLHQIAELLQELDPETRSARWPDCGGSQLIFCEEVNLHHRLIDAGSDVWRFGGDSDPQETGHWRIECASCGHELCTESEARGFGAVQVICDDVILT
jgi:hypothetical protein